MIVFLALSAAAAQPGALIAELPVPAGITVQDVHIEDNGEVWVVSDEPALHQLTGAMQVLRVPCSKGTATFEGGGRYVAVQTPSASQPCVFDRQTGKPTPGPFVGAMRSSAKWGGRNGWVESWVTSDHANAVLHDKGFTVLAPGGQGAMHELAGKPLALGHSASGNWVAAALVLPNGAVTISIFAHRDERPINVLGATVDMLGDVDADLFNLDGPAKPALTDEQQKRYAQLRAGCAGDCIDGQGAFTYGDGKTYTGAWSGGMPNGRGTLAATNGAWVYTGEVKDGQPHGRGRMTTGAGAWHDGTWASGKRSGPGKGRTETGESYDGTFANDQMTSGTIRHPDGREERR